MDADAIVVGAGPSGASAALHLARRGRHVLLLERHRFPRDKSCGDSLTRFATRILAEMDVLEDLPPSPPARGARIFLRGRGHRDFRYPDHLAEPNHGIVVPRLVLDDILCKSAVGAGAELWEETVASRLLYENGSVVGVVVQCGGESRRLRAPVVIAADGAASRLAFQAGLAATPQDQMGYAVRGYYEGIEGLTNLLEIYMPLLDPTDRYLLPSYGWVFPMGAGTANIGVGLALRARRANIHMLFTRFIEFLAEDPRFDGVTPCSDWRGAPLRFDFLPERCAAPGLLLVGDAAGMISPFTGEGIGYALESGRLAAGTVSDAMDCSKGSSLDLSEYPASLGRRFTGYFETGRQSARRFNLIWHVLESTFLNERPLFDMCRRAALFPEGIGDSYTGEFFEDVTQYLEGAVAGAANEAIPALVRTDLLSIREVLTDTVRRDWPFLARALTADQPLGLQFRPALLLLLAGYVAQPRRSLLVPTGAAVELGYLAALAQASVGEGDGASSQDADGSRPANWGNMFALMVGDFLFSQAYVMTARVAAEVSRLMAGALSEACEGHTLALRNSFNPDQTVEEHLEILRKKVATLFELPCRLGAHLSGALPRVTAALAGYGHNLGIAYQLIDDVLVACGRASELGRAVGSDLQEGVYSFPILHALGSDGREAMKDSLATVRRGRGDVDAVYSIARECGGMQAAIDTADAFAEKARASLQSVPEGAARASLEALVDYVVDRAPSADLL